MSLGGEYAIRARGRTSRALAALDGAFVPVPEECTRVDWPSLPLKEPDKRSYKRRAGELRARLLELQRRLREADFPVLLVFGGVDGAGKHELANLLTEWLDPRDIRTLAYLQQRQLPPREPPLLPHWRDLPARGKLAIVLSGWYTPGLLARARGEIDAEQWAQRLAAIAEFERDLVADGALLLKVWMHLDAKAQRERLRSLLADPAQAWQVQPRDWGHLHLYEEFMAATEPLIAQSREAGLPWQPIDGRHPRARSLAVTEALADALEARLAAAPTTTAAKRGRGRQAAVPDRLAEVAQPALDKGEYRERLHAAQAALHRHSQRLRLQQRGLVLVFEGWDAGGKGGAIRRMLQALDARMLRVHRIGAPDARERAHHYLWRFATRMPAPGHIAIFDRSWYGRVLVERVEGLAPPARWQAAYAEINRFEQAWTAAGNRLLKFWLHITPDEQLARFEARREDPLKRWKLTDEDWRNRQRWEDYALAANTMLQRCHAPQAPWVLVGANNKRHARVTVIESLNTMLDNAD